MELFLPFFIIVFFLGLYVYSIGELEFLNGFEGMETETSTEMPHTCPDSLTIKDGIILLHNSKNPSTEPLPFYTLDDYMQYIGKQRNANGSLKCPVLSLQESNNTPLTSDGINAKFTPSLQKNQYSHIATNNGVIVISDGNRAFPPFNQGEYPGFDPSSQYTGVYTNIDANHDATAMGQISPNPADTNWGGVGYTENAIEQGAYLDNNVYPPHLITPKNY